MEAREGEARESIVREWFRRVWNEEDDQAIDDLLSPDGLAHGLYGEVVRGPEGFRAFRDAILAVFQELRVEVLQELADGDLVAARCEASFVHGPERRPMRLQGTCFLRLSGRRIAEAWNHWDFLSLLEGMRLLPSRSFELALNGSLPRHPNAP